MSKQRAITKTISGVIFNLICIARKDVSILTGESAVRFNWQWRMEGDTSWNNTKKKTVRDMLPRRASLELELRATYGQ